MEAALCLHSNQTATKRPLGDLSSINQRRSTFRKHMTSLPVAAHPQRRIACSHVDPTPQPPEALKCRNANGRAAESGLRGPRAVVAGVVLACTLAGAAACMNPAYAQKDASKTPSQKTVSSASAEASVEEVEASVESPILRKTRTTLSEILLAQKKSMINRALVDILDQYYAKETRADKILLVNIYISMKEYEKAKEVCENLFEVPSDARPRLQMAVIDMMLVVEKMLEKKAKKEKVIDMINKAKHSWELYFSDDVAISKEIPRGEELMNKKKKKKNKKKKKKTVLTGLNNQTILQDQRSKTDSSSPSLTK